MSSTVLVLIRATSPEFFIMSTNLSSFYDFTNVSSSFLKFFLRKMFCLLVSKPFVGSILIVKGHQRATCFEQLFTEKFLEKVKLATAKSLKKSLWSKNIVLLISLCCSKFVAACVPRLKVNHQLVKCVCIPQKAFSSMQALKRNAYYQTSSFHTARMFSPSVSHGIFMKFLTWLVGRYGRTTPLYVTYEFYLARITLHFVEYQIASDVDGYSDAGSDIS